MNFNSASFPHPILSIYTDDVKGKVALYPEPEITSNLDAYSIVVNCDHDNAEMNALISSGQAEYFCEATCSNTLFREIVTSSSKELKLEIPKKNVKGKVSFTSALIAKEQILNYRNNNSHDDYKEYSFNIEIGEVLAFFGEFNFNADIKYEKLKAVSSFMEVVKHKDKTATYTNVDLNSSKIEVQLPEQEYSLFINDNISKEQKFASIFHSSIVLNALLIGLYNIENYKELPWAKVIGYRLKYDKLFDNISIEEKENIPDIAQKLLGNPFQRLISDMQVIIESHRQNEED